ncbi:MAG: S-methyl-5-thioribose-1-phosphate isomerase [Oscillospiraceae bacterium]|nr:S-methyl-5-thioribose-1-phosphate isomerase [Oscillospiraceae bacterium]
MINNDEIVNVRLSDDGKAVVILDQTLLPNETKYIKLSSAEALFEAIYFLRVRGAPAIGIFAAYALYVLARQIKTEDYDVFKLEILKYSEYLNSSRPTAVNLRTQLKRMEELVASQLIAKQKEQFTGQSIPQIIEAMREEADKIYKEDVEMCRIISEHGLSLIKDGYGIMTQCNAGPIATSKYGTGLGPIIMGYERGIKLYAYICETRPLLQGSRLTAYELDKAGVDCTLICDNMASIVMSEGKIDAVFAGCDRIARNGDVANKVGTSGLAVLAKHYGIPFYVFGPSTTMDTECATGADIKIELRKQEEIKEMFFEKSMAPKNVKCYNPAFDITDNKLITAIITEKGIFRDYSLLFTQGL